MLENIKNIILKNKKIFLFGLFILVFFYFCGDMAFAQAKEAKDSGNGFGDTLDDLGRKVIDVVNFLSQVIGVLLALLTYLSTMFLSPEWINGSFFGINSYLKSLWVLVSNVVYFIFAFILIGIAFMNIVGMGNDKFQLKQALPKFVVGILIVPFSWFIVQFVVSLSAILTIGALNLPFETFKGYTDKIGSVEIPKNCTLNLNSSSSDDKKGGDKPKDDGWFTCPGDKKSINELLGSNKSSSGIFGTIGLYTYGILGIENAAKFNQIDIDTIKNMGDLVVKVVFDALFILIYAILMIALGLVLMVRGIYIWIYMVFSPVFGLMFFLDKEKGGDSLFGKMNIKDFVSLAMVPVYSMLALSFGMLFLFVVGEGMTSTAGNLPKSAVKLKSGDNETSLVIATGNGDGDDGMSLTIKGAAANEKNITNFNEIFGKGAKGALGVIGSLILKIFGIVVLWGAMMAALKTNTITEAVVKPLMDFGDQVGKIAKAGPQYLPIFGGQSMQSMNQIAGKANQAIQQTSIDSTNDFIQKYPGLFGNDNLGPKLDTIANEIRNDNLGKKSSTKYMNKLLKTVNGNYQDLLNTSSGKEALYELVKKSGLGKDLNINSSNDLNNRNLLKIVGDLNKNPNIYEGAIIGYKKGDNIQSLQELEEKVKGYIGKTDESASSDNEGDTAKTDDKINQIKVGTQNINVQREATTDGSKGRITGMKLTRDTEAKALIRELGFEAEDNGNINTTMHNFIDELVKKYKNEGMTKEIATQVATQIKDKKDGIATNFNFQ